MIFHNSERCRLDIKEKCSSDTGMMCRSPRLALKGLGIWLRIYRSLLEIISLETAVA